MEVRKDKDAPTSTDKRLNAIIRLLMDQEIRSKSTTRTQQIKQLSDLGLSYAEIGEIVGWKPDNVGSELRKMKAHGRVGANNIGRK